MTTEFAKPRDAAAQVQLPTGRKGFDWGSIFKWSGAGCGGGCLLLFVAGALAVVVVMGVIVASLVLSPTPTLAAPERGQTIEQRCRSIGRIPGRIVDRDGNLISHYCPLGSDEY